MIERVLRVTLRFSSPVHHGSGDGLAGIVDRAFVRDWRGVPYLAGSALKGKFRYSAGLVINAAGEPACQTDHACRSAPICQSCELFGSARRQGLAAFSDAFPDEKDWLIDEAKASASLLFRIGPTMIRSTTAINRQTLTTEKQHLFTTETVQSFVIFAGEIRGRLRTGHVELLKRSAAMLSHFGADSARGLGHCSYEIQADEGNGR